MKLLLIFIFLSLLSISYSCPLLSQAFSSVSNFQLPNTTMTCSEIQQLNLSSKNLTGTISWMLLKNMSNLRSIDLSLNNLQGSIPGAFWRSPSPLVHLNLALNHLGGPLHFQTTTSEMHTLNLSNNRFTNAVGTISSFSKLVSLDLSHNSLSFVPTGLQELRNLDFLDVSYNSMSGLFPRDFPITNTLKSLNVSFNKLTGHVNSTMVDKFGWSAFISPGHSVSFSYSLLAKKRQKKQQQDKPSKRVVHHKLIVILVTTSVLLVGLVGCGALWCVMKRSKKGAWKEDEKRVKEEEEEEEVSSWVREARWAAAVVVFEKPLMELTFADLAAATSGFSKEWQMGNCGDSESRRGRRSGGELYRVDLKWEMQVVVRVMESERGTEEEAEVGFREMAKLRHPNLLPLLGYCIPGRVKLVLYEYMERGDLHQWLHELPTGHPDSEDWTGGDSLWEPNQSIDNKTTIQLTTRRTTAKDWPTRHKIALGIARGLAFLHQGWAGTRQAIIHGHLVPSNILLDDNLEPRIADFASPSGEETMESNVYSYGLLLMELVTGKRKWTPEEVEKVRKSVKEGKGSQEVDFRMRVADVSGKWELEMADCLRVGYLCTAESPEKRPTMHQVVGLIKDIRPSSYNSVIATTDASFCKEI